MNKDQVKKGKIKKAAGGVMDNEELEATPAKSKKVVVTLKKTLRATNKN